MKMRSSLAFFTVLAISTWLATWSSGGSGGTVAADVLQNRPTGPIPSFTDPLNIPLDDTVDTLDAVNTAGEPLDFSGVAGFTGFQVFGTLATFFRVFDTGYIDCGTADPGTTSANRPTADSPTGTGQLDSSTTCLIAPWVGDESGTYHVSTKFATAADDHFKHITDRVQMEINQALHQVVTTYVPTHALVVTWKITETALNHFQAVLATDGTTTYVLFIYGDMGTTIGNNVQGFISGGASQFARICNFLADPTDTSTAEAFMPEAGLKDHTNTKCGNPGVYLFATQDVADVCTGVAMECATNYVAATTKMNCNVSTEAVDSCTETVHCVRDSATPTNVKLTAHVKWYQHNYLQALDYATWVGGGSDATPDMEQAFVSTGAAPADGTCGKSLAAGPGQADSFDVTIDLGEGDANNRCGMDVAVAGELKYALKIFEYDGTTADFEPNGKFDRPGDLIIYGTCYYDDFPLSVEGGVTFNDFSTPTDMPTRSRSTTLQIVDRLHDTDAQVITDADPGRLYYIRICFDRGMPYTEQADPFAAYADVCEVSNNVDFDDEAVSGTAGDISLKFIDSNCPVTGGTGPPGPIYLSKAFSVQTDGKPNTYAYGAPPSPFCIYTSVQYFNRWNVFVAGALRDKLFLKCTVKFCTKLDQMAGGPEEIVCYDACTTDKRRKRSVDNTTEADYQETVYTSVTLRDPEVTNEKSECTKPIVAISTTVILIALLALAFVASVFIFLKLMKAMKKEKKLSSMKKAPIT